MELNALGWNDDFQKDLDKYEGVPGIPARVIQEHKQRYLILCEQGELSAEVSGRFSHTADRRDQFPSVGDWVVVQTFPEQEFGVIHSLLPRQSSLSRKVAGETTVEQIIVANVDTIFIVVGLDSDFNPKRMERFITTSERSGAKPVILLNKADLHTDLTEFIEATSVVSSDIPVHPVSAQNETGLDQLSPYLNDGQTIAFLGSSGVGKSTIINRLCGFERQLTLTVSEFKNKGRHTTTSRELIILPNGGIVIDTPGLRELQLWADESDLSKSFEDVESYFPKCRFNDCSHQEEPDCAVIAAIKNGELEKSRYDSYLKLQREIAHLARRQDEAASRKAGRDWSKRVSQHHKDMHKLRKMGLAGKKKDDKYDR